MAEKMFSRKECLLLFKRLGMIGDGLNAGNWFEGFVPKNGLAESQLMKIESAVREIGPENTKEFIRGFYLFSARRQKIKAIRRKIIPMESEAGIVLEFLPKIAKVIRNPWIEKKGFSVSFGFSRGDTPFKALLEIVRGGKTGHTAANFTFDLFYNAKGKPSAVLGSMQGGDLNDINDFRIRTGMNPLDFFLRSFKKGFSGKGETLAINPKFHGYRKPLKDYVVANSMAGRKKLTEKERDSLEFDDYPWLKKTAAEKVSAEKRRIVTDGTGMHKAALKKAGFLKNRSRYWRLRK